MVGDWSEFQDYNHPTVLPLTPATFCNDSLSLKLKVPFSVLESVKLIFPDTKLPDKFSLLSIVKLKSVL